MAPGRLAVATFADGAVLVDFLSGCFFRVNVSAAQIAERLAAGDSAETAALWLTRSYGLDPQTARRDVAALLEGLQASAVPRSANPFSFTMEPHAFVLHWQGRPVCAIDREGTSICSRGTGLPDDASPAEQLQWAVPHALLLRGILVLHASAVRQGAGVVAFCGASGAGKTTTARQFAANGYELIAEDLVVLTLADAIPKVVLGGEPMIRRWVESQAQVLAAEGQASTDGLSEVTAGAQLPLHEILFLNRVPLTEARLVCEPLGSAEGLMLLLANSFAELARADLWARIWQGTLRVVRGTTQARVHVPDGLDRLARAVADYTRTVK
jgi:hypothetical protein